LIITFYSERVTDLLAGTVGLRLGASVQRQSPMPLHHQIKVALLHGIEEGWLEPGRQLPRERELAQFLGVSLAPVRHAMADLSKEGYLDRTRGRGTFVRERKVVEKIAILGSFHEALRRQGFEPVMGVLTDEIGEAPNHVSKALGLRTGKVWKLRRQALIDGQPVALLTAWLPARYAGSMRDEHNFAEESLYDALTQVHGIVMSQADNLIEVDRAGLEDATQLRVAPGASVLKVIGVTRDQNNRKIEYSEVLYDADRFRFSIESRRMANGVTYLADAAP
jgi:GntR family transcriptional regulator